MIDVRSLTRRLSLLLTSFVRHKVFLDRPIARSTSDDASHSRIAAKALLTATRAVFLVWLFAILRGVSHVNHLTFVSRETSARLAPSGWSSLFFRLPFDKRLSATTRDGPRNVRFSVSGFPFPFATSFPIARMLIGLSCLSCRWTEAHLTVTLIIQKLFLCVNRSFSLIFWLFWKVIHNLQIERINLLPKPKQITILDSSLQANPKQRNPPWISTILKSRSAMETIRTLVVDIHRIENDHMLCWDVGLILIGLKLFENRKFANKEQRKPMDPLLSSLEIIGEAIQIGTQGQLFIRNTKGQYLLNRPEANHERRIAFALYRMDSQANE